MKRVIITGANGFLGSQLVDQFTENGAEVIAVDVSFEQQKFRDSELITKYEVDTMAIDDISPKITGTIDAMYHFAWCGVNGPNKADPQVQIKNIEMTIKCASFAKKIGVEKFLCAGTIAERSVESLAGLAHTSGGMMYGVAKYCAGKIVETYCKAIDLKYIWMQFANIYGPNNQTGNLIGYTVSTLEKNEQALFGPANQPYDFIYIDYLIDAVYKLGITEKTYGFYYIGSGEPRPLSEYLLSVGDLLNKRHLIRIGARGDDGIRYSYDMFDISRTVTDIGEYVHGSFEECMKETIEKDRSSK